MAATLSVTYTPNYSGNHRICFKTTGTAYCCYNDDSASEIGVPKTTIVNLEDFKFCLVDLPQPVGCAGSSVEGYVQPICIEQSSDVNRITFTAEFASTPCTPYNIQCDKSGIAEIQITEPGLGWLPGDIATVTITDNSGYGSGATADAVMACNDSNICYVESITITDAGQFYYLPDQISIDISLPTDPGGTPATAQVTAVENCGTFVVPDCDGTPNLTTYDIWGGTQYAVNICAGSPGPSAYGYTVTPNPTYGSVGSELPVSCCDCKSYNVVVRNPIDIYYTDCTQTIQQVSVEAGAQGVTICAVVGSIFPVNKQDNAEILVIDLLGECA